DKLKGYGVNGWTPAYLQGYHGMNIGQANLIGAIVLGAVGVAGLLVGGVVADWVRRHRPNGRMMLTGTALLVSTPCVYLAYAQPKGQIAALMVLMSVGWMLIYVYYVTVYPTIQCVVELNLRATAGEIFLCAMYMIACGCR